MEGRRGAAQQGGERGKNDAAGFHHRRRIRHHRQVPHLSRAADPGRGLSAVQERPAAVRAAEERRREEEARRIQIVIVFAAKTRRREGAKKGGFNWKNFASLRLCGKRSYMTLDKAKEVLKGQAG